MHGMWNAENYGIMELSENLRWDTLGDGHFSCAVSGFGMDILAIIHGFGQVFMVTRFAALAKDFVGLRVTPRHPVTREITCVASVSARVIAQKFDRAGGFGMTGLKGQLKRYVTLIILPCSFYISLPDYFAASELCKAD